MTKQNWGEVKHFKMDKRLHLGGKCMKKQVTIFGVDCAQQAKIQWTAVQKLMPQIHVLVFWYDKDFG